MKHIALIVLALIATTTIVGCQSKGKAKEKLPQLEGEGALPLPELPVIAKPESSQTKVAENSLVITGTARPIREAKVGPKGSGVISAMLVEEGDTVRKGQLLFRLESSNQALAVSQAEASLSSALIAESTAKVEFQRIRALHERGSVSPSTFDQVKAQFEGSQAAVKLARTAVARAKQAISDTSVRSPIDGVVTSRRASLGETVTMMPPTIVLIIQDISTLELRGQVPETMLSRLKTGTQIRVRFPAIDIDRTVEISRINPSVNPMTRTVEVVAQLPNKDRFLKAGMLVELHFESKDSSQTEPLQAASSKPSTRKKIGLQ